MSDEMACQFCGRKNQGDASDFYHRSDCAKRALREQIEALRREIRVLEGAHHVLKKRKRQLEKRLEIASYTGD